MILFTKEFLRRAYKVDRFKKILLTRFLSQLHGHRLFKLNFLHMIQTQTMAVLYFARLFLSLKSAIPQPDFKFLNSKLQFCNYVLNVSIHYRKSAIMILKVLMQNRKSAITNSIKSATSIHNINIILICILLTHLHLKTNSFKISNNGLSTSRFIM